MKNYTLERGSCNVYSLRPQTWEERHQTLLITLALILFAVSYALAGTNEFKTMQVNDQIHSQNSSDNRW